jgi:hypothetical protein
LNFLHLKIELEGPDGMASNSQPRPWRHESVRRNGVMPDVGGRSHAK